MVSYWPPKGARVHSNFFSRSSLPMTGGDGKEEAAADGRKSSCRCKKSNIRANNKHPTRASLRKRPDDGAGDKDDDDDDDDDDDPFGSDDEDDDDYDDWDDEDDLVVLDNDHPLMIRLLLLESANVFIRLSFKKNSFYKNIKA